MNVPGAPSRSALLRLVLGATAAAAFAWWAAWSASRSRRAPPPPAAAEEVLVWVEDAPSLPRPVTDREGIQAVVTPAGWLVFEDSRGIWKRRVTSDTPELLVQPDRGGHLWGATADVLLLGGTAGQRAPLVLRDVKTASSTVLQPSCRLGALSADGRWAGYADGSDWGVLAIAAPTPKLLQSGTSPFPVVALAFSPEGTHLALRSRAGPEAGAIEVVTLADGSRHPIAAGADLALGGLGTIAWPEPTRLVYLQAPAGSDEPELWEQPLREGVAAGEPHRIFRFGAARIERLHGSSAGLSFTRSPLRGKAPTQLFFVAGI